MSEPSRNRAGEVRIRSNVTFNKDDQHLVPGEIVKGLHRDDMTALQRAEKMYYHPCAICERTIFEIQRDGCERCGATDPEITPEAAAVRRREIEALVAPETWLAGDLEATRVVPQAD